MKKTFAVLFFLTLASGSFAQEVVEKSFWDDPINDPMLPFYLIMIFIVLTAGLIAAIGIYMVRVLNMLASQAEKEKATKSGNVYTPAPSLWQRFIQRMNASVPVSQEKDIELEHAYDGIKELDNHLPPWWTWLFYGTIAWSIVYIIAFHFTNTLPLSIEEYQLEVAVADESARKLKASQPETVIDESTLQFTQDVTLIEKGKKVYVDNSCGSCHRNDGGGNNIGPNLTDEYWLHGGEIKNVFATIKNGVVEKGMPAWGKSMRPEDVRNVAFFVMSLKGTNPPNPKAAQGDLMKTTAPVLNDSTNIQASISPQ